MEFDAKQRFEGGDIYSTPEHGTAALHNLQTRAHW